MSQIYMKCAEVNVSLECLLIVFTTVIRKIEFQSRQVRNERIKNGESKKWYETTKGSLSLLITPYNPYSHDGV